MTTFNGAFAHPSIWTTGSSISLLPGTVIPVNDVKITDAQAEIQSNFVKSIVLDLGAKVGYRVLNIVLSDLDNRDMKFNFKGPYNGLNAHF